MADNAKEELRPTTAQDTEAAAAAGSEGQSQEQESGKPPKEPGNYSSLRTLLLIPSCPTVPPFCNSLHLLFDYATAINPAATHPSSYRFRLPRQLRQLRRRQRYLPSPLSFPHLPIPPTPNKTTPQSPQPSPPSANPSAKVSKPSPRPSAASWNPWWAAS